MDILTAIGSFGFGLLFIGCALWATTKWSFFRLSLQVRRQLQQEAAARGDTPAAERYASETAILETRLPVYAWCLVGSGALVLLVVLGLSWWHRA